MPTFCWKMMGPMAQFIGPTSTKFSKILIKTYNHYSNFKKDYITSKKKKRKKNTLISRLDRLNWSLHFFFPAPVVDQVFREQCIRELFIDPQTPLFSNIFIKNGSHGTIHTFKNYFATIFSVFSFSKISSIQTDPKCVLQIILKFSLNLLKKIVAYIRF